jgi:7-cyano-7-deazaguanine synthase
MEKAIVLLSGGMDSATSLAIARSRQFECYALSIDYGQRHSSELKAARAIAQSLGVREHRTVKVDLAIFGGSALTDQSIDVPTESMEDGIPITYVPARNTVMLSLALAWAEVLDSRDIFIGVNMIDYSGYPDCRQEYIEAFETMAIWPLRLQLTAVR